MECRDKLGGWILSGEIPKKEVENLHQYIGFIYRIDLENKFYIGKKLFFSKKGKRIVHSDWKKYYSSNSYIKEYVKKHGGENVKRTIIKLCKTRLDLTYWELHYQVVHRVLFDRNSLNNNILGKFFSGKINP
jgi:hypothetical protein